MITEDDIVYAAPEGLQLQARIYRDDEQASSESPAVISIHGGAWSRNDRATAHLLDRSLAASGLTVFALDFRQAPDFQFPCASQDICAGIRFVRANAPELNVNVDRLGLIGSSSGGQLALLSALTHGMPHHHGTSILSPGGEVLEIEPVSAEVCFVATLWPVSDPLRRYHYAKGVDMQRLVEAHENYFGSEQNMHMASIQRILDDGEMQSLPSVWVAQPGADSNVPQAMTLDLLRAYQARGGSIRYAFYPQQPHAFIYESHAVALRCIADATVFIQDEINAPSVED
jgi:acetyl esterase